MDCLESVPAIMASQENDQIYMYFWVKFNTKFIHFVNFHGRTLEQMFQGNVWMCLYYEKHVGMGQEPNHIWNWIFYSLALTLSQTMQSPTAAFSLDTCVLVCSIWVYTHIWAHWVCVQYIGVHTYGHMYMESRSEPSVSPQLVCTLPCVW